ncbi:hypothetical protein PSEUBRA_005343 [Kalmanozyma brasiliensis GHG001]|uniref:uncharacterized protein n=1 Tax=Kalmanozyma brasiliensis (strain GHG001) TaxID=1365824 RepID=UPI002867F824|nr:uncharacterized protein PSEUBRA_005343 [Kalmanozyma brasiliensis GHG001]KAF6767513.1 hypothetical protein PSEUBRA_005343 [Kalmanozyma brasiliensis GHG001]
MMIFCRPFILAATLFCLISVALGVPDIIRNSEYGIRWLYEEAYNGRFRYNLGRDFPPLQQPWTQFLQSRGGPIINGHYDQNRHVQGWTQGDLGILLDRASGRNPTDHAFPDDRLVARQAMMVLVQRFAEEQAAARAARAAAAGNGAAGASRGRAG